MIADRIKSLREQRGITQAELSKLLGVTRSGVNAWEMGISIPSTQYLVDIAKLFNVSTDYLLGVNTSSSVSTAGLTDDDITLVVSLVDHLRSKNEKDR